MRHLSVAAAGPLDRAFTRYNGRFQSLEALHPPHLENPHLQQKIFASYRGCARNPLIVRDGLRISGHFIPYF